jgi:ribosome-dependent ATPase
VPDAKRSAAARPAAPSACGDCSASRNARALELRRDPIRLSLAALGSIILMLVLGYGITLDVEDLTYAVLDHDQTSLSRDYSLSLSGSRYFKERAPTRRLRRTGPAHARRRDQSGDRDSAGLRPRSAARPARRQVGAWIDGAMPQRAETVRGYVQGIHQHWLRRAPARRSGSAWAAPLVNGGDALSLQPRRAQPGGHGAGGDSAAADADPGHPAALSVVREKELGSIINFYVTPATRLEFLLGKQLPYVVLAMASFQLLVLHGRGAVPRAGHGQPAGAGAGRTAVCDQRPRPSACSSPPSCAARSRRCSEPRCSASCPPCSSRA